MRKHTRESIIEAIREWARDYGRPPTSKEWNSADSWHPAKSSVAGHSAPFASWADAIEAAGFPRPKRGGSIPQHNGRLTLPVRLCDLPLDMRLRGAMEANRIEKDPNEKLAILHAALYPSATVYWIAESARPMLEQALAA